MVNPALPDEDGMITAKNKYSCSFALREGSAPPFPCPSHPPPRAFYEGTVWAPDLEGLKGRDTLSVRHWVPIL